MAPIRTDFRPDEEAMISLALDALGAVGYDIDLFKELIRVDLPAGY